MRKLEELGKIIETDVLVIGAGIAGLWAAVRARDYVDEVTVVDKGPIGRTSQAYFCLGGQHVLFPEDDVDEWVKDVVYIADGLVEQDVAEEAYKQSYDRMQDYQRLGVDYRKEKKADGTFRGPTRGLEHVRSLRPHPFGTGGSKMIAGLVEEANRLGIRRLSRIFMIDIVKKNRAVSGALGFHAVSGEFHIFKARAIVVTTGECHFRGHYPDMHFATGDGMAMAFRAGAELRNLEFPSLVTLPPRYGWEGLSLAYTLGAQLLNAKGEPFLERYSPILKSKIDYNYVARAMALEAREGRGPFHVDFKLVKDEDLWFLKDVTGWMRLHRQKLEKHGIQPFVRQDIMPGFLNAQGIKTDIEMKTQVPGLFAGGRARFFEPGILMGGWNICMCNAFGRWAGESAGKYARSQPPPEIDVGEVAAVREGVYGMLGEVGVEPQNVLAELQDAVFQVDVLILKHENGLKGALDRIEGIRDVLLPRLRARDVHYLVRLKEVVNMTLIAELMLRASLMRTESRGSHYREDHPRRDDQNWLKWIDVSEKDGEVSMRTEPVPLDRYRFRPTRYYMDNFRIPN